MLVSGPAAAIAGTWVRFISRRISEVPRKHHRLGRSWPARCPTAAQTGRESGRRSAASRAGHLPAIDPLTIGRHLRSSFPEAPLHRRQMPPPSPASAEERSCASHSTHGPKRNAFLRHIDGNIGGIFQRFIVVGNDRSGRLEQDGGSRAPSTSRSQARANSLWPVADRFIPADRATCLL